MIGIDTNLLIRMAMQDDPVQCAKVDSFLASLSGKEVGFVSLVTLIESVWVLEKRYRLPKPDVVRFVQELLDAPELKLERDAAVSQALHRFTASTADFADCLIERVSHHAGCTHTVTFDLAASKSSGMVLLQI
jgi:predicted nucleic-acid-binding protein